VDPAARGRGLGRALLREGVRLARAGGFRRVYAAFPVSRVGAVELVHAELPSAVVHVPGVTCIVEADLPAALTGA